MNDRPTFLSPPRPGKSPRWLALLLTAGIAGAAASAVAADVTMDSLLHDLTDYSVIARWPSPEYTLHQNSSYDRARRGPDQPGWFANNDFSQYVRDEHANGRTEHVMMDADGPGCIVRFWLTTGANKKGTLRIYLDGRAEPTLSFPAYDLLTGDLKIGGPLLQPHPGYSPTGNGGSTLMLPIPYAKHCQVTWEEAGDGPRYYQINYRTYAPGTVVQTFTPPALAAEKPLIAQVGGELLSPPKDAPAQWSSAVKAVPAGASVSLDLPPGPAAVQCLELRAGTTDTALQLRSLIVQIQFDGEDTVWCPAGDFFGSGVGRNPLQNWYRTVTTDGTLACRWVMPYAKAARITLLNLGDRTVAISLRAGSGSWVWDERSMHFHAAWHYEANLATPPPRDWNAIRISGRGLYAGDTLALFNPVPTWYGEGDEKIRVDHESFPSFIGTGMEDYYDFSFAPRGVFQTPFASQVRIDQAMTQGNNVLTRTRNLDGLPFSQSLDFNFELIAWQPTQLTYAMTTYWYAFPGASSNVRPQPDAARQPLPAVSGVFKSAGQTYTAGTQNSRTADQPGPFGVAGLGSFTL